MLFGRGKAVQEQAVAVLILQEMKCPGCPGLGGCVAILCGERVLEGGALPLLRRGRYSQELWLPAGQSL